MSALGAAISIAAGAILLLHAAHFDHIADDAYISLRYLDHWLRGEGLVFNSGERVMGYSNFLWLIALAPLAAGGIALPAAAQALGATAAFGCVALVCNELVRRHATPWPALAAGAWLAASAPFALWSQAGLEGPLFALWLVGAAIGAGRQAEQPSIRRLTATAVCLAAAAWTRPEGVGYGIVVAGWIGWRTGRRDAAICLAASVGAWLALGSFALGYYGDWLPNTYYAKAHPLSLAILERGWIYTWAYLKGQYGATAIAIALFAATAGRSARAPGWLALALLGAFVAYYLRIGGDALVYHRMWAYVQPLIALALGDAVGHLIARQSSLARGLAAVGCALPLLALPHSLRGFELAYLRADDERIRSLGVLGRELAERAAPDTLIATNVIGALGFYSRLPLVDMLGLTDRHIARAPGRSLGTPGHESHDGAYVLDREPDLILVGIPRASQRRINADEAFRPAFPSDRDLALEPRLLRDYALGHWTLRDGRHVALFVRRGYDAAPPLE
jgi:hypothetical protein